MPLVKKTAPSKKLKISGKISIIWQRRSNPSHPRCKNMLCLFLVSLLARAAVWLLFNSFLALLLANVFSSGEGTATRRLLFCLLCITSLVSLTGFYNNDEL